MPWKLAQWKPCDGGCSVRSPRFPRPDRLGTVPGRNPRYMAGDVMQMQEPGGTSPDGIAWVGGNRALKELWELYESVERNAQRIRARDVQALPSITEILARTVDVGPAWAERGPLQWHLDTDFGWPVRGPHIQAMLGRLAALGLWDPDFYSTGMDYDTVFPDEWVVLPGEPPRELPEGTLLAVEGHVAVGMPFVRQGFGQFGGQTFHVEHWMTEAERAVQEPACCHMWVPI